MAGARGWPTSETLERLRSDWIAATGEAEQKRLAVALQEQAWIDVPFVPLGQILAPVVHSRSIRDLPTGFSLFWNVRRV